MPKQPGRQPIPRFTSRQPFQAQSHTRPGIASQTDRSASTNSKISTLKAYRKARGECFTCGEKWGPGQLHVVEELLAMLPTSDSEGEPPAAEVEVF